MRPFPDGGKAVSTLRSAGFGVGVLTNSSTESAESLVIGRDWSPARRHGRRLGLTEGARPAPDRSRSRHRGRDLGGGGGTARSVRLAPSLVAAFVAVSESSCRAGLLAGEEPVSCVPSPWTLVACVSLRLERRSLLG